MNKPNSSLSHFIEEYPLYSKFGLDQPIEATDLNNLVFNFFCKEEKEVQPFRLASVLHNNIHYASSGNGSPRQMPEGSQIDFTEMFTGVCQSCGSYRVTIIISGGAQKERPQYFIRKIGQYPAPESGDIKLPDDMAAFLPGDSREHYRNALKNLDMECGAGAFVCFQKVIKNEIERIVEILANPYSAEGNRILQAFAGYKSERQKTRFIEEVTPLFPKSLQEHGAQVLLVLYDALFIGVHDMEERECFKKAKDIDALFRYLIRKIYAEINDESSKTTGKYFLRYS